MPDSTETTYRIAALERALRAAAVLLRSTADLAADGQRIEPQTLRDSARVAEEIAGLSPR